MLLTPEPPTTVSLPVPLMVTLWAKPSPRVMLAPTLPPETVMARAASWAVNTLATLLSMVTFSKPETVTPALRSTVPPPVMASVSPVPVLLPPVSVSLA
jgi:hypothetical protein